jgi:secondary thiamine-phosphate synthase enzyme
MPVVWQSLRVTSSRTTQLLDITDGVARACQEVGDADGLVVIFCPHTTAGVVIQEAESGLLHDLEAWLLRTVPPETTYRHDRVDDNAASHLRAVLAGSSAVVPLQGGRLGLGTWQRILCVELDGPRTRQIAVGILR